MIFPLQVHMPPVEPQLRAFFASLGFVVGLFALQTAMLAARPQLPDWWICRTGKGPRHRLALILSCTVSDTLQVFTYRSHSIAPHRGSLIGTNRYRVSRSHEIVRIAGFVSGRLGMPRAHGIFVDGRVPRVRRSSRKMSLRSWEAARFVEVSAVKSATV